MEVREGRAVAFAIIEWGVEGYASMRRMCNSPWHQKIREGGLCKHAKDVQLSMPSEKGNASKRRRGSCPCHQKRSEGGLCKHEKEGQLPLPLERSGGRAWQAREGETAASSIR